MGRGVALVLAGVLALVGCLGLLASVPAVQRAVSPRAEPVPLPLRVPGPWYDQINVELAPGRYAIWATRPTRGPDRDRCRVTGPDGRPVPVREPGHRVDWVERATDDTLWAWASTFTAAAPGSYRLTCRLDPGLPGQQYAVTREPDRRLLLRLRLARSRGLLVAALPAGLVILVMTLTWRRRSTG
ncbi:hypothetical protein [Micromonospora sp. NPDC050495]|uniref:hypothetical protein n=1 Tax=Micromonospora sp. NPDC050495 TaxID=3154936 RepID=UPI0033C3FD9C